MQLSELLAILYTAHNRFSSVQVDWSYWYDVAVMNTAQERWAARYPPGSVAILRAETPSQPAKPKIHRRVWWQKPGCWREDSRMEGSGGTSITILCREKWWSYSADGSLMFTNVLPLEQWLHLGIPEVRQGHAPALEDTLENVPLLDPAFLLASHDLQPKAETTHAGREAVQVRAAYQKGKSRIREAFFWAAADAFDLLVDKEYGILLRYAALLDGQEYAVSSVNSVVFNQPIREDVFRLSV